MADLLLAADMAYPLDDYARLPKDVRVVLGYVGGETPHVWTAGEVRAAEAAVGTWWPIWTAPNPNARLDATQGRRDAAGMVAALRTLGISAGVPVFYDIEQSSYAASPSGARSAWQGWRLTMQSAGWKQAFPYVPWSAEYGWAANWTNTRPDSLPAGLIGWQYEGNTDSRGYDLSVFDAALIGDTMEAADVWDVPIKSPTNGETYTAEKYLIGADVAARQAAADVAHLVDAVAKLQTQVAALAKAVGEVKPGGLTARQVAAGLGAALTAGAPRA